MTKDTHRHRPALAFRTVFTLAIMVLGLAGCGQKPEGPGGEQKNPAQEQEGPDKEKEGPVQERPADEPSNPAEPSPTQPALPRDSMVEAMLRIQLAEAYRARYYVLNAGASANPPMMDSLYAKALAPLGISPARYEATYRDLLDKEPVLLQALYDSCESILQRRLIGLR
jgi:predicted small lipoprotein YifL